LTLASGTRLRAYEIRGAIGAGGMGEVYRAADTKLGREVAIKVLPAELARDPERLARFEREAKLLASLNHPNIAHVYGFEAAELPGGASAHFLAMELVEGEDLAQRLSRGAIPVDEALTIAGQIAQALEEAHEKGIVHRDLKPANVKVTPEGKVKVLDFGLAKAYAGDAAAGSKPDLSQSPTLAHTGTHAGVILGTAGYMSPEQARGRPVDKRADIWAFGVVLYEMLTGSQLFTGETASDTLAAVLRQDADLGLLPKQLAASHRRLIERCLERDPRKRLRDIGEARLALEGTSGGETAAPPAAAAGPGRRPSALLAGALAVVAFAAGWAVGSRGSRTPNAAPGANLKVTPMTASGNVIGAAVSPDGRYIAFVESDQGRQSLWLQQTAGGQTLRLIPEQGVYYWGHTFTPDGNGIVFGQKSPTDPLGALYSISTLGGTPKRLVTDIDSSPSYSPDGRRMAFLRQRHPTDQETALMVAGADGSDPKALASFELPEFVAGIFYGAPAWSPDGSVIVTAVARAGREGAESRARLVSVSIEDGEVTTVADPGWVTAAQAGWLPDGRSLLVIARAPDQFNAQIWSVSYPAGEARRVTADLNDHRIISLTKDGRSLVSVAGDVSSSVWTLPLRGSGSPRRVSRSTTDGLNGIALAPDGNVVYTAYLAGVWSLWTAGPDGANRSPLLEGRASESLAFPSVAEDGTVYYVARTRAGTEIRATSKDGSSSRVVARDARFETIGVAPDASFVAFGSMVEGVPRLFRVAPAGGEARPLVDVPAFSPSLDPSGRLVAYYHRDGEGRFRLGVSPTDGGPRTFDTPIEPPAAQSRLVLRDDGVYLNTLPGDRANVWLQPLDGSAARKLTSFQDQLLFDFAVSRDGATLAVARGPRLRDAQLITGFEAFLPGR